MEFYIETVFSYETIGKEGRELLDKITLPESVLRKLRNSSVQFPYMFKVSNPLADDSVVTLPGENSEFVVKPDCYPAGVYEFSAPENVAFLPTWMMHFLKLQDGSPMHLSTLENLPSAAHVRFEPISRVDEFMNREDEHTGLLQSALMNLTALSIGEAIPCGDGEGGVFMLRVTDLLPASTVSLLSLDGVPVECSADIVPPASWVPEDILERAERFRQKGLLHDSNLDAEGRAVDYDDNAKQMDEEEDDESESEDETTTAAAVEDEPLEAGWARCTLCRAKVQESSMELHSLHCERFCKPCGTCGVRVHMTLLDKHIQETHAMIECECGEKMTQKKLARHQTKRRGGCPKRACGLCGEGGFLTVDAAVYHSENLCGNRTTACDACGDMVRVRSMQSHIKNSCQESKAACNYCSYMVVRKNLGAHQDECGQRTEKCGCCKQYVKLAALRPIPGTAEADKHICTGPPSTASSTVDIESQPGVPRERTGNNTFDARVKCKLCETRVEGRAEEFQLHLLLDCEPAKRLIADGAANQQNLMEIAGWKTRSSTTTAARPSVPSSRPSASVSVGGSATASRSASTSVSSVASRAPVPSVSTRRVAPAASAASTPTSSAPPSPVVASFPSTSSTTPSSSSVSRTPIPSVSSLYSRPAGSMVRPSPSSTPVTSSVTKPTTSSTTTSSVTTKQSTLNPTPSSGMSVRPVASVPVSSSSLTRPSKSIPIPGTPNLPPPSSLSAPKAPQSSSTAMPSSSTSTTSAYAARQRTHLMMKAAGAPSSFSSSPVVGSRLSALAPTSQSSLKPTVQPSLLAGSKLAPQSLASQQARPSVGSRLVPKY